MLAALHGFMDRMGRTGQQMGAFGEAVPTGPEATDLDRLLGRTGRDPAWVPASCPSPSRYSRLGADRP